MEMEMKALDKDMRKRFSHFFDDYQWNYIAAAILEGDVGNAYGNDVENPQIAVLELPKLKLNIIGGDAGLPTARRYIERLMVPKMMVFTSEGWERLLMEYHRARLVLMPRVAFTSENLDIEKLQEFKTKLPSGYQMEKMNEELAQKLANEKSDFASTHFVNFNSIEDFIARGFGFCVTKGGEIVSVATTFLVSQKGIEIQITTREMHQRKGLGTAVAAELITYSLDKNLDPNWDAANKRSVNLAKKLGYTPQGSYTIFILVKSKAKAVYGKIFLRIQELLGK